MQSTGVDITLPYSHTPILPYSHTPILSHFPPKHLFQVISFELDKNGFAVGGSIGLQAAEKGFNE